MAEPELELLNKILVELRENNAILQKLQEAQQESLRQLKIMNPEPKWMPFRSSIK